MSKHTIRDVKQRLAETYPDIEFSYGQAGRGRMRAHCVSWIGGPAPLDVRTAAGNPYQGHFVPYHFHREPTRAELDEMLREWDIKEAARRAAEPAKRAAAKADGIAKRQEAAADRKRYLALLTEAFPDVAFTVSVKAGRASCTWTDGPEIEPVIKLIPTLTPWRCTRHTTPEWRANAEARRKEAVTQIRIRRRLDKSRRRHEAIKAGIARRARQREKTERESRQLSLVF
jgi:hypothetical protein